MDIEKAYRLARAKLDEHGLQKWDVMFDGAKSRFGCCWHSKQLITMSMPLIALNDEAEVLDTILHEIAHALVEGRHGHDKVWKQKAREIGCNGNRCYGHGVVQPTAKYSAVCPNCAMVYQRHRRVGRWQGFYCSVCFRKGEKVRIYFTQGVLQAGLTKAIMS